MKQFLTILISLAILAATYVGTFGVPERLAGLLGATSSGDAVQAASGGARGGPGGGPGRRGPSTTSVVLIEPEFVPYSDVLRAVGGAISRHRAEVRAGASGIVVEANLGNNQMVEAGEVLLRLDDKTEVLNVDIARAELDQARQTMDRYEALGRSGNATITEVARLEAEVALQLAEARLGLAEEELDDRIVRAPVSGRLGLSDIQVGDRVSENDQIVTVDDTSTLLVEFELPERAVGLVQKGRKIQASTPTFTGQVFEGEIIAFDSRLDPLTRSVTVRAEIPNDDGLLWSGMTFGIRVYRETDPLPKLPATAITWDRNGSGIWLASDGKVTRVPATILYRTGNEVWVDADIPESTTVVAEGAHLMREGGSVTDVGPNAPVAADKTPGVVINLEDHTSSTAETKDRT